MRFRRSLCLAFAVTAMTVAVEGQEPAFSPPEFFSAYQAAWAEGKPDQAADLVARHRYIVEFIVPLALNSSIESAAEGNTEGAASWRRMAGLLAEDHARSFGTGILTRRVAAYDGWSPAQVAKKAESLVLSNLAAQAGGVADFAKAITLWNQALELEREIGDRWEEGRTLSNLLTMHYARGEYFEALRVGETALAILREVGDRWGEGVALGNVGLIHTERGEFSKAFEFHQKALAIKRDARDRAGEGITLGALGQLRNNMGQYREAVELDLQALQALREKGERGAEGMILDNLGLAYISLGESVKAREAIEQALAVQNETGDRRGRAASLIHLGTLALQEGNPAQAQKYFEESLALHLEIGERQGQVTSLEQLGILEARRSNFAPARKRYEEALKLSRELGLLRSEASILHNLGIASAAQGDFPAALTLYEEALTGYRQLGDRSSEAEVLLSLGVVRHHTGDAKAAVELFEQSVEILRSVGNRLGECQAVSAQGSLMADLGRLREAVELHGQALAILREIGARSQEPNTLTQLGIVHRRLGDFVTALRLHREAADIARQTGNRSNLADALGNVGVVQMSQGDSSGALESVRQSLEIYKQMGDRVGEARALNNMGEIYSQQGNYTAAAKLLREALSLERAAGVQGAVGSTLGSLAGVYESLGDRGRALATAQQALEVLQEAGLAEAEAGILNLIGNLQQNSDNPDSALAAYEQALAIHRSSGNRQGEAGALINLAALQDVEGKTEKALAGLAESLAIARELKLPREEGVILVLFADIHYEQGDARRSLEEASRALELFQQIGAGEKLWGSRARIGRAFERLGRKAEALAAYRQAVAEAEAHRGGLQLGWERTLLLFPRSQVYVSLIDLLVDLHASEPARGYDREAFRYVQLAKARSLRDLLEGASAEATAQVPQELLERRRDLARRIVAVEAEIRRPGSAGKPPQSLELTLEALEREEMQVVEQIRTQFPEYAALAPQPVAIEPLQQVLRPGELLVEYFLTPRRIILFAVARDRFALAETKEPLRSHLLPALVLRDLLRNPEGWDLELSQDLYDRLLKPVESDLQRAKAVYIAPDGILHYLPFEILGPDGKVLIDAPFSISYVPSASVLETLRRRQPPRADRLPLLVVADPVGWEAPKESGGPGNREVLADLFGETGPCSDLRFQPLAHAGGEALALAGVYGLDPAGPEVLLRENATEARLRTLDLQRFRYLHFATHGVLCDDGGASSLRSSLVLSAPAAGAGTPEPGEDGLLDVHEIFNLSLDTDLVTLSACQTGLGSQVAGEGLVGLTQAFLYAGSRSVLVSLWSVEDRSTARFMKRFYRNLRNGMSRGAALQETKRWMLYESYDVDPYGNQLRHVHPFYWAPFILIGSQD